MTEPTPPLLTFYQGWSTYQQMLLEMLSPLTPEHLALPASSHAWTIGQLAQHMIGNRVWWFQVWMGEGNPDLAPIARLRSRGCRLPARLRRGYAGCRTGVHLEDDRSVSFPLDARRSGAGLPASLGLEGRRAGAFPPFSRQWIIWHTLEHEIHHGGELSLALGARGLAGMYGNM